MKDEEFVLLNEDQHVRRMVDKAYLKKASVLHLT